MLDPDIRRRYEAHLTGDPESAESLRTTLQQYLAHLESAFDTDAVFNLELAQAIGQGCLQLLDDYEHRPDDQRRAIQAACCYLVDAEDGDDDLQSVMGFDDDAAVFNHVAETLGRIDLLIDAG